MGNYVTTDDLVNALGEPGMCQLFNDGNNSVDAALVAEAIADAEAECDSILGPGFVVPIVAGSGSIPRIVKRCGVDIAIFYGYERKPEFRRTGGDNPEQKRYDRAVKTLRDLKSGERDMGNDSSPIQQKSNLTVGLVLGSATNFIVDPNESLGASGGF